MKAILSIPLIMLSMTATAGCPIDLPTDRFPEMTQGSTATKAKMYYAQGRHVQGFGFPTRHSIYGGI